MTPRDPQARSAALPAIGGDSGPVLVIADNAAIAGRANAWAIGFEAVARVHRVRLVGWAASDVDAIVAEALDLGATAILAAGGATARRAGEAVAMRLGLPLTTETDAAPRLGS